MKKKYFFSPPGERVSVMVAILVSVAILCVVISSVAMYSETAGFVTWKDWAGWTVKLPTFGEVIRGRFAAFWLYAAACAAMALKNYRSFRAQSRSDYVMKRIKSSAEKHFMCLSVPAIGLCAGLLLILVLLAFHLSGCIGDLYNLGLLLFKFRDPSVLREDTGPKQIYYTKD